jgi:succinate dehydrogenase / fumarate reductase flavoprotein subunit
MIRNLMIEHVGVYRDKAGLTKAVNGIRDIKDRSEKVSMTSSSAQFNLELLTILEFESMVSLAQCIAEGALRREESRGSHSRTDFEKRVDDEWLHHTIAKSGKDGPVFSKKTVDLSVWEPQERKY